jgi:parallel beta-helix repeat protein
VSVTKDGIRLIGRARRSRGEKVILVPGEGQKNGIVVQPLPGEPPIEGSYVRGFTVQGFSNNGIITRYVNDFRIERNESIDNKENGIWPILSANGLVRRNVAYGSDDSGLWVEDSVNIRVIRNVLHSSVTGLEVSQSDDILVKGNEAYNNAAGIGLYMQPGRVRKETNRTIVLRNYVHDNNRPNSAPPGSMAADLPSGGGILVLGPDASVIKRNRIENNGFFGVAVVDYCLAMLFSDFNCFANPPDMDPAPQNNQILRNTLVNNGTAPPDHPMQDLAADIVELTIAQTIPNNCYRGNKYATSSPEDLPDC